MWDENLRWISLAGAMAVAAGMGYGASDMPVGLIIELSGSVSLQSPVAGNPQKYGQAVPLKNSDVGRLVYSGDRLSCRGAGQVRVHLDGVIFRNQPDQTCKQGNPIEVPPAPGSYAAGDPHPLGTLNGYLLAGRPKGSELAIYAPADKSAVVLERLALSWTTKPDIGSFVLVLLDPLGHELARSGKLNGTDGSADSGLFRRAIADYLAGSPAAGDFRLVFRLDEGGEQTSAFAVLTNAQEREVSAELTSVGADGQTGLFAHLQRAAIFDSHRLYNDEAAEYDMALSDAPDSATLLRAAASVNATLGDLRRSQAYSVRARQSEAQ